MKLRARFKLPPAFGRQRSTRAAASSRWPLVASPFLLLSLLFFPFGSLESRAAEAPQSARETQRSSVKLRGGDFTVELFPVQGALPLLPDLSTPGETRIPRSVILRTAQPVLWHDRIVPPGEYELLLVVTPELTLAFGLETLGAGAGLRVRVERADYAEPADGISASLLSQAVGKRERAALQVRWGSLLLQGNFEPLVSTATEAGRLRLTTYEYPEHFNFADQVFLGTIESIPGATPNWVASLSLAAGQRLLRLEDREFQSLGAEQKSLRRRIALLKVTGPTDPLPPVAGDVRMLEARLKSIERRLTEMSDKAGNQEIVGEKLDDASAPLALKLIADGDRHRLSVATRQGTYLFLLP